MFKGISRGRTLIQIVLLLLISALVAGCEKDNPTDIIATEELVLVEVEPVVLPGPIQLPDCDLAPPPSAPVPIYPAPYDIVLNLQPEFDWTFGLECKPMGYHLDVFTTAGGTQGNPDVFNSDTGSLDTQYSSISLQAATLHKWRVCAIINEGAMECHIDPVPFVTGPICGPGDLVAPTLIYPEDGAFYPGKSWGNVYEVETDIAYPVGNCIPDKFTIYISATPDFSTPNLNVFSVGAAYSGYLNGMLLIEDDSNDVLDCTTYYWRAWAMAGESDGPFSETFTFYTNIEGNCFLIPFEFQQIPWVLAPQNINCRAGDTTEHDNIATLLEGDEVAVLAVNPAATHVRLVEERTGVRCWIWLGAAELMLGPEMIEPGLLLNLVPVQFSPLLIPDPGTPQPIPPQCSDGIDNDGDGFTDYVAPSATGASLGDPQCSDAYDDDESS